MMQVIDTHRVLYKNAQLRAYKASSPTTPLAFVAPDGQSYGNIIYTNEQGYMFYGESMQPVTCLCLPESAIVQVSLDGGVHWSISWVIIDESSSQVAVSDVHTLTYYAADGTQQQWNPLTADGSLPDYICRDEFDPNNAFRETSLVINDNTCALKPGPWVETVLFTANATANTIQVDLSTTRDGQVFFIYSSGVNRRVYLNTPDATELVYIANGQTVIVQSNFVGATKLVSYALIDNVTYSQVQTMIDNAITSSSTNVQRSKGCYQTENDQLFALDMVLDGNIHYIKLSSDAGLYDNAIIQLNYPPYVGCYPVVFDIKYEHGDTNSNVYLKLGTNPMAHLINVTDTSQHIVTGKILRWTDFNSMPRYAFVKD